MKHLLQSITVNSTMVKNRIVMAPLVCFGLSGRDGVMSDLHIDHYVQRAQHGVGLIVLEAICVRPEGRLHPTQLGVWSDKFIEPLSRCAQGCHQHGAVLLGQIHHAGMKVHPDCGHPIGPDPEEEHQKMSIEDIRFVRQSFIDAAVRLQKAGFDGVQVHGCHGYLLNSFSNRDNQRDDGYGRDLDGRTRLSREILQGIRDACGSEFIVTIRMPGNDPDIADGIAIARQYVDAGFDMLSVSAGIGDASDLDMFNSSITNGLVYRGYRIREAIKENVPVGAVGGLTTPEACEEIISQGTADFAEIGRGLLADYTLAYGLYDDKSEYVECFQCAAGCRWFKPGYEMCPAYKMRSTSGRITP